MLLQVIIELRHSEPLRLFRPYEELYRSLTEKELPEKGLLLPGFQLDIAERRMRIVVDPRHTAIVFGNVPNIGYCVDNTMGVLRKISDFTKLPPLMRLGVRGYWIEESVVSFAELVSLYKETIYKPNSILRESTDIGATFTLVEDKYTATLSFGPMQLSQLETMLTFKPAKLPEVVVFLDVDYFWRMEPTEISGVMLRDFVNKGLNYADKQSQRIMRILRKEEG